MAGDELVTLAHENFVASFLKLAEHCVGGECRQVGGVFAFVTGLPLSFFNGCVVLEQAAPADLDEALAWVVEQDVPSRLFVTFHLAEELAPVAAARGFARDRKPYPGMALRPIPEPPTRAPGVEVASVVASNADDFRCVGVGTGLSHELAERMFPTALFTDPDVQAFVGTLDGRLAGYSLLVRSERACGVYNVGTLPEARRRGVGTALTWAAVDAGRHAGFDCAVLQSSEMARALYEAMGFRWVVDYAVFRAAAKSTGQETPVPPRPQ